MRERSRIGALIEQQKRLNGLSDQGVVDRAVARGEKLSKANLSKVATGETPSITKATIFGLAAGLGITPATVAKAALGDMGIIITEQDADTETAIRTDPTLSEGARRVLLTLLREVRDSNGNPRRGPVAHAPMQQNRDIVEKMDEDKEDLEAEDRAPHRSSRQ